ncbi:MAG: hypothetical protein LBL86_03165 [Coriobacteriales bacterium]|jgi:hypothetical protein|nr:hypothetical protein [Coriobacteriales bacterium]
MKEHDSFTVSPSSETAAIERKQRFGWELFSTQEVKIKDSHLEGAGGNSVRSVTETEHYIKLSFQRDTDMPNYTQLKALEGRFNGLHAPDKPAEPSVGCGMIIAIIVGFALWIVPGVILLLVYLLHFKPKTKEKHAVELAEYNRQYERYSKEVNDIYAQAEALLRKS